MSLPIDHEKQLLDLIQRLRAEQSDLNLINSEVSEFNARMKEVQALYDGYLVCKRQTDAAYEQYRVRNDAMKSEGDSLNNQLVEARSKIQGTQTLMLDVFIEFMLRN